MSYPTKYCGHTVLLEIAKLLNDDTSGNISHAKMAAILEKARADRNSPCAEPLVIVEYNELIDWDSLGRQEIMKRYRAGRELVNI